MHVQVAFMNMLWNDVFILTRYPVNSSTTLPSLPFSLSLNIPTHVSNNDSNTPPSRLFV